MATPCFPTLGEVAKSLFDHASLLARKGEHSDNFFDEKKKKSFQTSLARLAKEDGDFNHNLTTIIHQFLDCIHQISPDTRICLAIDESIHEVFEQYRHLIRNEGTCLSKKDTIHWLLRARFIDSIVLSTQKNKLRFNIKDTCLITPNKPYWFLPIMSEGTVVWPLASSLKWAYTLANTSQSRFHYPDESPQYDSYRQSQNLQNASKWLNNKKLPNWGSIYSNISESLNALQSCNNPNYQRNIDEQYRQSILWVLFISRLTTSIGKAIEKQYGRAYLANLIEHYIIQDKLLNSEAKTLEAIVECTLNEANISDPKIANTLWYDFIPKLWRFTSNKCYQAAREIQPLIINNKIQDEIPTDLKHKLIDQYGEYAISLINRNLKIQNKQKLPRMFPELYFKGDDLRKQTSISLNDINEFQSLVKKEQLQDEFQWLIDWIKATHLCQSEKYPEALHHYQKSFEICRYAAGQRQYDLVNEYIAICSKTDQTKKRQKAITWAKYLGIKTG